MSIILLIRAYKFNLTLRYSLGDAINLGALESQTRFVGIE